MKLICLMRFKKNYCINSPIYYIAKQCSSIIVDKLLHVCCIWVVFTSLPVEYIFTCQIVKSEGNLYVRY